MVEDHADHVLDTFKTQREASTGRRARAVPRSLPVFAISAVGVIARRAGSPMLRARFERGIVAFLVRLAAALTLEFLQGKKDPSVIELYGGRAI